MGQLEKFPSSYSRHGSFLAMQVQERLASLLPLPMPAQEKRHSQTCLSHARAESKPAASVTARGLRRPDALPRSCRPGASRQALAPGTRKVSLRRRNRPRAGCCRPGTLRSRAEILESSSPPCASVLVVMVVWLPCLSVSACPLAELRRVWRGHNSCDGWQVSAVSSITKVAKNSDAGQAQAQAPGKALLLSSGVRADALEQAPGLLHPDTMLPVNKAPSDGKELSV